MGPRFVPLAGDGLDDLPARCRACVFWELGERPARTRVQGAATDADSADDRVRKQAWVTARAIDSGPPGARLVQGSHTLGYVLYAPATSFSPPAPPVPRASPDALLLATAWLDPEARAGGHGGAIVQAAVREALRLELRAVEAYGDRRAREWDCVLPATWLLHEGFEVLREHPRYPLLRIDTKRVARWADSLEHAVEELLGRSPRAQPAPTGVTSSR